MSTAGHHARCRHRRRPRQDHAPPRLSPRWAAHREGGLHIQREWNPFTNLIAREDWLKANPALAYAVRDAYDEVLRVMTESKYEILREKYIIDALPVLKQEDVLATVIKNAYETPYFTNKWDRPAIDAGNAFIREMAATNQSISQAPDGVMVMLEEFVGPRP